MEPMRATFPTVPAGTPLDSNARLVVAFAYRGIAAPAPGGSTVFTLFWWLLFGKL